MGASCGCVQNAWPISSMLSILIWGCLCKCIGSDAYRCSSHIRHTSNRAYCVLCHLFGSKSLFVLSDVMNVLFITLSAVVAISSLLGVWFFSFFILQHSTSKLLPMSNLQIRGWLFCCSPWAALLAFAVLAAAVVCVCRICVTLGKKKNNIGQQQLVLVWQIWAFIMWVW